MHVPKRRLIKDPVWGAIEVLSWESLITNHFIFNRLHNVIQNSSGFRAYPGLRSSRFSHTIGVMHVATQISLNAITNVTQEASTLSDPDERRAAALALQAITTEAELSRSRARSIPSERVEDYVSELSSRMPCPKRFETWIAIVRVASLLHDIGHLPCSHIFENALEAFLDSKAMQDRTSDPTARAHRKGISEAVENASEKDPELRSAKLHELVSLFLAEELAVDLAHRASELEGEGESDKLWTTKFCVYLLREAILLLTSRDYKTLATAIKGTIDADRLDFTRRDGVASGLFQSGIDFGRLFALYTVRLRRPNEKVKGGEKAQEEAAPTFWICPSARSVSDVEKLLWERFQDYRYINAHHKVHFYDAVVENILLQMLSRGLINDLLDSICKLLAPRRRGQRNDLNRTKALLGVLLEFDDPWLETRIRSVYKGYVVSEPGHWLNGLKYIPALFDAYVENRERFKTLFKSDADFWSSIQQTKVLKLLSGAISTAPGADGLKQIRDQIQRALEAAKLLLQEKLSDELGCTVIISPTTKKVRHGMGSEEEAKALGVEFMRDFLRQKKYRTPAFNCWYSLEPEEESDGNMKARLIGLIDDFLCDYFGELRDMLPVEATR